MPLIFGGRVATLTSEAADGEALPSNFVGIGASDGSLLQALLVETAGNPNLRVAIYDADTKLDLHAANADALNVTLIGARVHGFNYEFNGTTFDRIRHSFHQETAGINSNGAGTTIDIRTTPMSKFTLSLLRTSGTGTWDIDIEGSPDGTTFRAIASLSENTSIALLSVVDQPMRYIRYNVIDRGGTSVFTLNLLASAR